MRGSDPEQKSTIVVGRFGRVVNLYSTHKSPAAPLYQQSAIPALYWL